jgi:hypothetical protein
MWMARLALTVHAVSQVEAAVVLAVCCWRHPKFSVVGGYTHEEVMGTGMQEVELVGAYLCAQPPS